MSTTGIWFLPLRKGRAVIRIESDRLNKMKGFTLIELVVVIVILGILAAVAAPKFIDLTEDAKKARFVSVAAAFKGGIKQVHVAWLIRGNNQAVQNFIEISDPAAGGDLSVNEFGYPADTRGFSKKLDSEFDCIDVWRAVLDSQDALVEGDDSSDIEAVYNGSNECTYIDNSNTSFTVIYNSNTGNVQVNT